MHWLRVKMKWRYFKWFVPGTLLVLVLLLGLRSALVDHAQETAQAAAEQVHRQQQVAEATKKKAKQASAKRAAQAASKKRAAQPVDWRKPSQDKAYPDVAKHPQLEFDVDLSRQRVYLKDHGKVLYTMYASSGVDDSTPHGHYKIQAERGTHFFNGRDMMGANYYTSWLDHGKYLFHSVPTDANGQYITQEANKLGKQPGSHGCVRLTIPDAKWIFEHAKVGMAVNVA